MMGHPAAKGHVAHPHWSLDCAGRKCQVQLAAPVLQHPSALLVFLLSSSLRVGLQPPPEGSWQKNAHNQLNLFFSIGLELPACLCSQCSDLALSGHQLPSVALALWIQSTRSCSAASFLCREGLARHVATQLAVVYAGDSLLGLAADKPCKTSGVKNVLLLETEGFLMPFRSSPYHGLSLRA